MRTLLFRLRAFARDTRAAAAIELAIATPILLLPVASLSFDFYKRVEADTVGAQLAATMADYVSRGPDIGEDTLDGDALKDLGTFLHEHVLGVSADLVFIVSALRQPAGNPAPDVEVLWSDATNLHFGDGADDDPANGLDCASRFVEKDANDATLPSGITAADFTMRAKEVLVVAEVCIRLTGVGALSGVAFGPVYRHHVLPARAPGLFPHKEPVYALRGAPALAGLDSADHPAART